MLIRPREKTVRRPTNRPNKVLKGCHVVLPTHHSLSRRNLIALRRFPVDQNFYLRFKFDYPLPPASLGFSPANFQPMNPFMAYMQHLAKMEENFGPAASRESYSSTHDDDSYANGSVPCSPLIIPSSSLRMDLLDADTQSRPFNNPSQYTSTFHCSRADASLSSSSPDSSHHEASFASTLFGPHSPAFAYVPPHPEIEHHDTSIGQVLLDAPTPTQSFESAVDALADEVLSSSNTYSASTVNYSL